MEETKSEVDLTPLEKILPQYAPQGRTALLPALHAAQAIYGYIPEQVAAEIGRSLQVPLVDVFGVVDFYALFYREPVGKTVIHVCGDPACALAGADTVFKVINQNITEGNGSSGAVTLEKAPCLGLCEHAPALIIN
jgi:NADH-quinone oxidoreductase subunit F